VKVLSRSTLTTRRAITRACVIGLAAGFLLVRHCSPSSRHNRTACEPCSVILPRVCLSRTFASRKPSKVRNTAGEPFWAIDRRRSTRGDADDFHAIQDYADAPAHNSRGGDAGPECMYVRRCSDRCASIDNQSPHKLSRSLDARRSPDRRIVPRTFVTVTLGRLYWTLAVRFMVRGPESLSGLDSDPGPPPG
jgi:hypothetical protein